LTGHSKGGAESKAGSAETGFPVYTFNTAEPNFRVHGLDRDNMGRHTNVIVQGDLLRQVYDLAPWISPNGEVYWISGEPLIPLNRLPFLPVGRLPALINSINAGVENHGLEPIIHYLENRD